MMSVNNAITRLANKKQIETDNLYMLFVFRVIHATPDLLQKYYSRYSGRCNRVVVTSHIYFTWACTRIFLRLFGANVLAGLAWLSPGRTFAGMSVWALVCAAPAREQLS